MVTIVASWDAASGQSLIHMVLEKGVESDDARRARARQKVEELESQFDSSRVEVIYSVARSLDDFRSTDPRFASAPLVSPAS